MDYSKFNNISGVYQIISLINNKIYIGSSVKIRKRINRHQNDLKNNKHGSKYLQNTYNLYGNDNLNVEVLEYCEKTILIEREQYYLDSLKPYNKNTGFNTCDMAGSPSVKNLTEKTKKLISNSLKGHTVSDETKKKIGDAHRGKIMSKQAIEKIIQSKTGKKQSEKSIEKRVIDYSFIDSKGNIYIGKNLKRFCDEHNLFRQNMRSILNGVRKSHHGFRLYKK